VELETTCVCELLVGPPDFALLGVEDKPAAELRLHVDCHKPPRSANPAGARPA